MKQTKQSKAADKLITSIFTRRCQNIQISVLGIGKVYAAGRAALAAGQDPEAAIVAFVETIRKN